MTALNTPNALKLDYVVEIVYDNNPQNISSFHYESFEKALEHYSKIADNTTNFIILAQDTIVTRSGSAEDFKRLMLAKNK